ncbi:zinc fingers and homeoboxes protein 2-like isoform X2 [Corythoichthys intestinalis]|nr:zinc fingers and homeoboxes protein 2-like isoform X2 [Corythoichthys intestinalis]
MPGRRKSSAPHVVQIQGPGDSEDLEMLDTEMFSDDVPTKEPKAPTRRKVEGPERENLCPEMSEDQRDEVEKLQSDHEGQKKEPKCYEYKCCPFRSATLEDFKEHVDSSHPDVILDPLYRCAICDFDTKKFELFTEHNKNLHPDKSNLKLKRIKENDRTVLEQIITVQGRSGSEGQASPPFSVKPPESLHTFFRPKETIAALNINGTVIIPDSSVLRDPSHVSPVLQRPPNFSRQPKIAVPLNGGKYDPSLDRNPTLMASFNKFPYPTHAELSWLTAASKHPEEQIKVWFTTQRLKQGITWSPEEVEEARKKMFNGSFRAAHHTFTAPASNSIGFAENCSGHALKRSATAPGGPESKRLVAVPPPGDPKEEGPAAPQPMAPLGGIPPFAAEMNKSPAVVPLMPSSICANGKLHYSWGNAKTKPAVSLPPIVFPESLTRPTIAPPPIFAPPFTTSILLPRRSKDTLPNINATFPDLPPLVGARARRPPVIQSAHAPGQRSTPEEAAMPEADAAPSESSGERALGEAPAAADFPLLERMKGKTAEQLKILEEHFLKNSSLFHGDADNLALATRLSRREIDGWFAERRALRDNMEMALLNSMGAKRTEADKEPTLLFNGIHEPGFGAELLKRGSLPPSRAFLNSQSTVLFKHPSAQSGGTTPSEVWPGLARIDLARWFCDARSAPDPEFLHNGGGPENAPSDPCFEGRAEVPEAEPSDWCINGVNATQRGELQDCLAARCE